VNDCVGFSDVAAPGLLYIFYSPCPVTVFFRAAKRGAGARAYVHLRDFSFESRFPLFKRKFSRPYSVQCHVLS